MYQKRLNSISGRYASSPLDESQVDAFEKRNNFIFPKYFRAFLIEVGLPQSIIPEIYDDIERISDLAGFLPKEHIGDYIHIGGRDDDYWLIRLDDPNGQNIYMYDYYKDFEIKLVGVTFKELFDDSVDRLLSESREGHSGFHRSVSISFNENQLDYFLSILKDLFDAVSMSDFNFIDETSAGVLRYSKELSVDNEVLLINKSSYHSWPEARINLSIYMEKHQFDNSRFSEIHDFLEEKGFEHKFIDYGILS